MARKRLGGKKGKGKGKKSTSGGPFGGPVPSNLTGPDKKRHDEYRAEEDFRTLERAEEVRGDGDRHGKAMDHGRKRIAAMHRIMSRSGESRSGGRR